MFVLIESTPSDNDLLRPHLRSNTHLTSGCHPPGHRRGCLSSLFTDPRRIEIPEAWMPTIKQQNSRLVPRWTAEGTISSLNDEDRNPAINNSLQEDRNAPIKPTKVLFILLHNQSTPSVDTIA